MAGVLSTEAFLVLRGLLIFDFLKNEELNVLCILNVGSVRVMHPQSHPISAVEKGQHPRQC